jgi:glycopeptide antibiotics resistance protein
MRYVLLIIIVLISYGSLYPFKFSGEILNQQEFFNWLFEVNFQTTRADKLANILLFVPYGFVTMIALKTHKRAFLLGSLTFFFGVFLALTLQYIQLYIPARVPDALDALYNSFGILVGMFSAYLLRQYSHSHSFSTRSIINDWSKMTLPLLLALVWLLWRLYPYVPLFTAESIARSVEPLFIAPVLDITTFIRDAIGWLVFYYLMSRKPLHTISRFKLLQLTLLVLAAEVLIKSNQVTVGDLLAALSAFAFYTSINPRQVKHSLVKALGIGIVLFTIEQLSWQPESYQFNWLPFYSILKMSPWLSVEKLLLSIYFFASFIYLLRNVMFSWFGATLVCVVGVLMLELIKGLISEQAGDITYPIIALIIGIAMSQFETLAKREREVSFNS